MGVEPLEISLSSSNSLQLPQQEGSSPQGWAFSHSVLSAPASARVGSVMCSRLSRVGVLVVLLSQEMGTEGGNLPRRTDFWVHHGTVIRAYQSSLLVFDKASSVPNLWDVGKIRAFVYLTTVQL